MKYLKCLLLIMFLFPISVFADDSITIKDLTLINKEGLAVELNPASVNGTTISLDAKMYEVGDSIEYQFTIENNTNNEYEIDTSNLNSEYVNYQLKSDNGNILKPASSNTYTLIATYDNEVPQNSFKGGKFEVGVDQLLELKDPSLINPLTGNFFYIILLFVISVSLIFILKLKYKKTIITALFIGLFILPYYTRATETIHLDFGLKIGNILPTFCTYDGEVEYGTEYVNGQFTYYYGKEYLDTTSYYGWRNIGDGWSVQLTDKSSTDPVITPLCTYINDIPVTSAASMFYFSRTVSIDTSSYETSHITSMNCMFTVDYPSDLAELDVSNFDTSNVTDMSFMFCNCACITSLDLSNFDTSNVTNMKGMFESCESLTSIDLRNFDTSKVINMSWMFECCESLTSIDLRNFDTSNVTNMECMFECCYALTSLDLSSFDTSNVVDMSWMFDCCNSLTSIDLSNFDTSNVTNMKGMFWDCYEIDILDLSSFDMSNVTNTDDMFYDCTSLTTVYARTQEDIDILSASSNLPSGVTFTVKT